jgi:hypothetical protein
MVERQEISYQHRIHFCLLAGELVEEVVLEDRDELRRYNLPNSITL